MWRHLFRNFTDLSFPPSLGFNKPEEEKTKFYLIFFKFNIKHLNIGNVNIEQKYNMIGKQRWATMKAADDFDSKQQTNVITVYLATEPVTQHAQEVYL